MSSLSLLLLFSKEGALSKEQQKKVDEYLKQESFSSIQASLQPKITFSIYPILIAIVSIFIPFVLSSLFKTIILIIISTVLLFLFWRSSKQVIIPCTPICEKEHEVSYHAQFSTHPSMTSSHYEIDSSKPTIIQVGDVMIHRMNK